MFPILKYKKMSLKFGDIVKVKFNVNKPPSGLILFRNAPRPHSIGLPGYFWQDTWNVKSEWFKFSLPKNVTSAHGILVENNFNTEYLLVYFPRILKSGASCVLDIEYDEIINHTDIVEAHKLHKYVLELTKMYKKIDNFGIIETVERHRHGHV